MVTDEVMRDTVMNIGNKSTTTGVHITDADDVCLRIASGNKSCQGDFVGHSRVCHLFYV